MPAAQGKDAERFDAAVELGTPPGAAGDAELARDLEIVAMLRSRGAASAPDADAKARAKQRLMAALAADPGEAGDAPDGPRPPVESAAERTAPIGRIRETPFAAARDDVDATAVTARMAPVTEHPDGGDAPEAGGGGTPGKLSRPGRRARHSMPSRPSGAPRGSRRPGQGSMRRRTAFVGAAALVMMVVLTGAGIFASRDALPGDALYGIKRAAESAGLALTFDDTERAQRHLEMATTRLDEVERLVRGGSTVDPELVTSAIQEFDVATDEGSRMLLSTQDAGDPAALDDLHSWAGAQSDRLAELRPVLPAPATDDADTAIAQLEQLAGRTAQADTGVSAPGSPDPGTSGSADATGGAEDGTTDEPDAGSSTTPDGSEAPSGSATSTPGSEEDEDRGGGGLLPDLGRDDESSEAESSETPDGQSTTPTTTTAPGSAEEDPQISVPLPLLPPITLPPLLPGMPGITIG
ncbi:DUF5667 domain-containing protein [Pseudonocardia nigra]|uniref:DUF5667 domain-containing protein n=1 Tax=Pseudonocardia nigra TaxID=1921578 RepID=UPI001C5F949E|nr:DUF5667 domain-containing protein [Pseudonocardia nigra]